jgi:hypothetical protein
MRALQEELRRRKMTIPFRGIRDADPKLLAEDIGWLRRILAEGAGAA